ncbi:MAG: DUF262 domain-containing protein [Acholeplasmatales bacterium]|jgi:hypothetical protein|nr:DUF262 domain-containing protein [Acholeplasmatales bacterium]
MNINLKREICTIKQFLELLSSINLSPQYQREFVYTAEQSSKVIDSILLGLPLNILYLNENTDSFYKYEVIDGQQRLRSISNFINHSHSLIKMSYTEWNDKVWNGFSPELKQKVLDYNLEFYIATKDNDSSVKLDLFKRINTVGDKLTTMELLNATYPGIFIEEIKKFCHDNEMKLNTVTGKNWKRGDTEEILLEWFSPNIPSLLAQEQHNSFDNSLFPPKIIKVINWIINNVDVKYRNKIYNSKDCLRLYEKYNSSKYDTFTLFRLCEEFYSNQEIQNRNGIFEYALELVNGYNPNVQLLNLRYFPSEWKQEFYLKQDKKCAICGSSLDEKFVYAKAELDHIVSWKNGGTTIKDNCQLLCQNCNRTKSGN